jgi:DNA anti-recombination protein RmuC
MSTGTAVAPNDALFKEFQSYVQAIYDDATSGQVKSLKSGLDQAVDELQGGVKAALKDVDGRSSDLREAISSARQDFYGLFTPIFADYRAKLIEDNQKFIDRIVESHRETYQTHRILLDSSIQKGLEENSTSLRQVSAALDEGMKALKTQSEGVGSQVSDSNKQLSAGLADMRSAIEAALSRSDSLVREASARAEELSKSAVANAYAKVESDLKKIQAFAMGSMVAAAAALVIGILTMVKR